MYDILWLTGHMNGKIHTSTHKPQPSQERLNSETSGLIPQESLRHTFRVKDLMGQALRGEKGQQGESR